MSIVENEPQVNEDPQLTFAQVLLGSWSKATERVENGRKLLHSIKSIIRDLEQLEKQHSANLRKLANKLVIPTTESASITNAASALRSDLLNRAHHSMQFAQSIHSDVLEGTVEPALLNHSTVFDQIKSDATRSQQVLTELQKDHADALQAVSRANKLALRATLKAQDSSLTLAQHKRRLHMVALEAAQEEQAANERYQESVEKLNAAHSSFNKQLKIMLIALEDMDKKRIDCMRDSLMKIYVYRASQSRNMEYDTTTTVAAIQEISSDKDIQEFLIKVGDSQPPASLSEQVLTWPMIEACCKRIEEVQNSLGTKVTHEGRGVKPDTPASLQFIQNIGQVMAQTQAGWRELQTTLAGKEENSGHHSKRDRLRQSIREQASQDTLEQLLEDVVHLDNQLAADPQTPDLDFDYSSLMNLVWDGAFETLFDEFGHSGITSCIDGLSAPVSRLQFCQILTKMAPKRQYRIRSVDAYQAMCHLCLGLLEHANANNDFWCGRMLMLVAQQIYTEGMAAINPQKTVTKWSFPLTREEAVVMTTSAQESAETTDSSAPLPEGPAVLRENRSPRSLSEIRVMWRLSHGLYEHPLWNRVAFWEEALTLTMSEDQQRRVLINAWKTQNLVLGRPATDGIEAKERRFSVHNPCAQSLCLFAYHMSSFGIQPHNISHMVEKLCDQYGFSQDYTQQLLECMGARPTGKKTPDRAQPKSPVTTSPTKMLDAIPEAQVVDHA